MTADIYLLPNTFNQAVEQAQAGPTDAAACLDNAREAPLIDVAIVGRGIDGQIHLWGSHVHPDATIGLLMRGAAWLSAREQITSSSPQEGSST